MRTALLGLFLIGCSATPPTLATSSDSVKGLEVEGVEGLGLFSDERARSQVMLTQALVQRKVDVFPTETAQRAWALAAAGRNPFSGASCGMPLSPWAARKRWGAALGITGRASAHVWCRDEGECALSVNGSPRMSLVAPIAATGDALGALGTALGGLAPPPPSDGRGGGGLGLRGGSGSSALQEEDLIRVRTWRADRRDRTAVDETQLSFPGLTAAHVQSCLSANETNLDVLLEVAPNGTVGRCEGAGSTEAGCACGQLARLAPAAWMSGKRWGLSIYLDRRDQTTSDRRLVLSGNWNTHLDRYQVEGEKYPRFRPKVEDPSIEDWSPGSSRLAIGCFVDAFTAPGSLNSRWAVWFDEVGRPNKVLEQKGFAPLPKEQAECVARALRTALSPCPSRAGLWAMAQLQVSARDPNAPPSSPIDLLIPDR